MTLSTEELDALLEFLERQWMPEILQRAYDKLADERRTRGVAETRLSDLERRLRDAVAAGQSMPPAATQNHVNAGRGKPLRED